MYWHGYDGECNCHKPLPGLLLKAARKKNRIKKKFYDCDRWRDMDEGHAAGSGAIFIDETTTESSKYILKLL